MLIIQNLTTVPPKPCFCLITLIIEKKYSDSIYYKFMHIMWMR